MKALAHNILPPFPFWFPLGSFAPFPFGFPLDSLTLTLTLTHRVTVVSDSHYQSPLDAVSYVVPWREFPIVFSYPHHPHSRYLGSFVANAAHEL